MRQKRVTFQECDSFDEVCMLINELFDVCRAQEQEIESLRAAKAVTKKKGAKA